MKTRCSIDETSKPVSDFQEWNGMECSVLPSIYHTPTDYCKVSYPSKEKILLLQKGGTELCCE